SGIRWSETRPTHIVEVHRFVEREVAAARAAQRLERRAGAEAFAEVAHQRADVKARRTGERDAAATCAERRRGVACECQQLDMRDADAHGRELDRLVAPREFVR